MTDTTGYTQEELLGDPGLLARVIAPASASLMGQILERARKGEVPDETVEWSWRRKDGHYAVHESVFAPIHEGGKLVALHVVSRDVTDRRRAEEARRRRAAREELLSDVSRRFLDDDPETAIDAALERLGVTLDAERVSLFAPDLASGRLQAGATAVLARPRRPLAWSRSPRCRRRYPRMCDPAGPPRSTD